MFYEVEQIHGVDLKKIFENSTFDFNPFFSRGFRSIKRIPKQSILFIGINPSYNEADSSKSSFYEVLSEDDKKQIPYFNQTYKVINEVVGQSIGHLDLLFHRETVQKKTQQLIRSNKSEEFIKQQLQISKSILENCNPSMVVVCNSLARHLMGFDKKDGKHVWIGYDFDFDEDLGTHKINSADSKLYGKPIFFTSMLSGQRALDKGSFKRLNWHIKFVLNKMKPRAN